MAVKVDLELVVVKVEQNVGGLSRIADDASREYDGRKYASTTTLSRRPMEKIASKW